MISNSCFATISWNKEAQGLATMVFHRDGRMMGHLKGLIRPQTIANYLEWNKVMFVVAEKEVHDRYTSYLKEKHFGIIGADISNEDFEKCFSEMSDQSSGMEKFIKEQICELQSNKEELEFIEIELCKCYALGIKYLSIIEEERENKKMFKQDQGAYISSKFRSIIKNDIDSCRKVVEKLTLGSFRDDDKRERHISFLNESKSILGEVDAGNISWEKYNDFHCKYYEIIHTAKMS